MLEIRSEVVGDRLAIVEVHASAFSTDAEARLVDALRAGGKASVSLVAELEGTVIGHVLFSPISVAPCAGVARGAGLAPLAVFPEHRRQGVGGKLIQAGIEACLRAGFDFVVVLGEPAYYRRFGFRRALDRGLRNEYGADEEFMVLELRPGALSGVPGLVKYAPEFAAVEA